MAQTRNRVKPKVNAAMDKLMKQFSTSYCPECGLPSELDGHPRQIAEAKDGDTVCFTCPEHGKFTVERRNGTWMLPDSDIPYIMHARSNSVTQLYRYDYTKFDTEAEAASEKVRLMCETAMDYLSVRDTKNTVSLLRPALLMTTEAMKKGYTDSYGTYFGCISLYFDAVSAGSIGLDEAENAIADILEGCGSLDNILKVGVLSMCAEALKAAGSTPNADFIDIYDDLSSNGPGDSGTDDPFARCTFWEALALVALDIGKNDDVKEFIRKDADAWLDISKGTQPADEVIDRFTLFIMTLYDNIQDDWFDELMGEMDKVFAPDAVPAPYMQEMLTLVRYEHRLENGLCPYDRAAVLDSLIEKYSEPANGMEASIRVKALVHRAGESEDIDDALGDMSSALETITSTKLYSGEYRDIVMEFALMYLRMTDDDKKTQRSVLMKLKKIGITRDSIKAWKQSVRKQ